MILLHDVKAAEKAVKEQATAELAAATQDHDKHNDNAPNILTPDDGNQYDLSDNKDDNKPP